MIWPVVEKSARLVESEVKERAGKLLDIGCGYGFFLKEMKSRGWHVQGIEISQAGRQHARETWSIQVHSQAIEDLALSENVFDVVTIPQSLFLVNPLMFLFSGVLSTIPFSFRFVDLEQILCHWILHLSLPLLRHYPRLQ